MPNPPAQNAAVLDEDDEPLIKHRRGHHEANFDITAMIDLVFMMNIFFLVTTVAAAAAELDLPVIRHCIPTDPEEAVTISMTTEDPRSVTVYLGEETFGKGLTEPEDQVSEVRRAVEEASRAGKEIILIRAERSVKLKDIKRIGLAATKNMPGMKFRMAVIEKD
jgi:biopolymer transport protein ExbD